MKHASFWACALGCALILGCGDEEPQPLAAAERTGELTFWQDMAPLFSEHCLSCHREGGIAPLRLDDYAHAKPFAKLIADATRERRMPPWGVTSDGSCGEFADSLALDDAQIARIGRWVEEGAKEGVRASITIPEPVSLMDATELTTPLFQPEIEGGELAEADEYRCFELPVPVADSGFITGYEVVPGRPEIVHHVVAFIVDPRAPAELPEEPQLDNGALMQRLDRQSPDRDGWPCWSNAGEGVAIAGEPVVWAPGQGVVRFPSESGVPVSRAQRLVVQVHYNLSDPRTLGLTDQTRLRLQLVPQVKNVGVFVVQDDLLGTLFEGKPATLPPGQRSTLYQWSESARGLGLEDMSQAQLHGIMPHMHQLGRKYQMTVSAADGTPRCAADVQRWDFHWQRMYFYEEPLTLRPDTQVSVTCDYDTSSVKAPVKPGWGTRNEMCTAIMYVTIPATPQP